MSGPLHLKIFLSSPGDVIAERQALIRFIKDELPYDELVRGRATFDVLAWDDRAQRVALLAGISEQASVDRAIGTPSECDLTVVVLRARLGTPLYDRSAKTNGSAYRSGTEWELWNALDAQKPVIICRGPSLVTIDTNNPTVSKAQFEQASLLYEFTEELKARNIPITLYEDVTELVCLVEREIKRILRYYFDNLPHIAYSVTAVPPLWQGSPYPGLRAFNSREAQVYYGRSREIDELIARLSDPARWFLAVVGASGSGKSSLVNAGLIPRLEEVPNGGSQHWQVIAFPPAAAGNNPFLALAIELSRILPPNHKQRPVDIAEALQLEPKRLLSYAELIWYNNSSDVELILFVDQFEELFTLIDDQYRPAFFAMIKSATAERALRVLIALRADFLSRCAAEPALANLLEAGTFVLSPPGPAALLEMIRKPAERAGLPFEDLLADEILKDAGGDAGALPLIAFCLEDLYRIRDESNSLTLDSYRSLGGIQGAIGRRAGQLLAEFRRSETGDLDKVLDQLLHMLVRIDATGRITRRRAFRDIFPDSPQIHHLVEMLIQGRLLLGELAEGRAVVTLAHEALLQHWPAIVSWLDSNRAKQQRVQRILMDVTAPKREDRLRAIELLDSIGPVAAEVIPALVTALKDSAIDIRKCAARALGQIGPGANQAISALIAAFADGESEVRNYAAQAIGQIGADAIPTLLVALVDANVVVRGCAGKALGQLGAAQGEIVPALITALCDPELEVRFRAAEALAQIGPPASGAIPALIAALSDSEAEVRYEAADALGQVSAGVSDAIPALCNALCDDEAVVRFHAAGALVTIQRAGGFVNSAQFVDIGDYDPTVIYRTDLLRRRSK